ncbi:hypothetical protein TanjilG_07027 [Lupinus angustifolius]|uniref:X8 domain-containing protein n=1 Tax=Lupinus angustifolius TaxID=3871 RepID=A0A4P1QXT9_LUPAN|nr:PREDICTED: DNA-directed RNA polymerase II subunit RPB1-like [Lupinus angustifolius]OIV97275.1 hypothetical protein TanjilG_07027 [Lupinus angustifolius]
MRVRCWHFMLFCLCLFINSGLGTAIISRDTENKETSSYEFSTQLDSVPIINPTTPDTDNPYPTLNPTSPQPPDTTGPVQTPTSPYTNPTTPDTTPTSPYNNPTTPDTTPTTPDTTPKSPYNNPTTPDTTPTSPYTNPTTPDTSPTSPYTDPTTPTNPYTTPTTTTPPIPATASAGGKWCVASQSATEKALKVAIDYACGYGGADCSALQPGASCYNPNTIRDHASYAFNDYYQKNPAPTSCAFGGTATLTNKDPSNGNCHYASSKTTSTSPPTIPPSTMTPTAPNTMTPTAPNTMTPTAPSTMIPTTPPSMTIPGGASVSNLGPEGSPNIATSDSYSLLLMFTLFGLWASHYVENYI